MKDLIPGFNPADANLSIVDVRTNKHSVLQQSNQTGQLNDNVNISTGSAVDPQAVEEKFRIDRKKLEAMLQGGNDALETAETFFEKVMYETKATIIWPSKLKIGAKSKKDPHVKVSGRPDQVRLAKERIMANLDVKRSRVCLKIDVAYPDHSHLIGKKGSNIQRIMEYTRCQIHFPDSNRNNSSEKSNQVSITGLPCDVENARSMIRCISPLTFTFDIPAANSTQRYPLPPNWEDTVIVLRKQYGIAVTVKPPPMAYVRVAENRPQVTVRGCENDATNTIEGTNVVLRYFSGPTVDTIAVMIIMDIAPHHHDVVKTRCQLHDLEGITNTRIFFTNPDSRGPSIEKSPVRIVGSVDGVYTAKKEILKYLPVLLTFDLPDDHELNRCDTSTKEMCFDGIQVMLKPKPRDGRVAVIFKGIEGDVNEMYRLRDSIINGDVGGGGGGPFPLNPCPSSALPNPWNRLGVNNISTTALTNGSASVVDLSTTNSNMTLASDIRRISSGGWNTAGGPIGSATVLPPVFSGQNLFDSSFYSRFNQSSSHHNSSELGLYSGPSSTTSSLSSPGQSPRLGTPIEISYLTTIDENNSTFCHNDNVSLITDMMGRLADGRPRTSTPALMTSENSVNTLKSESLAFNDDLTDDDQSRFEDRLITQVSGIDLDVTITSGAVDYAEKRRRANQALQKTLDKPEVRFPTDLYSGCGFSASMPPVKNWHYSHFEENGSPSTESGEPQVRDPWGNDHLSAIRGTDLNMLRSPQLDLTCSNYMDSSTLPIHSTAISMCMSMHEVLKALELLKYSDLFRKHEIDLQTFVTLNESDLRELGLSKLGPRRKLLAAIAHLKSKPTISHAPGAERKLGGW